MGDSLPTLQGWGSWLKEVVALAKVEAPLEPSPDAPWSWVLVNDRSAPPVRWLLDRDPTARRKRPLLQISWPAVFDLASQVSPPRVALVAAVRAGPYIAQSDAVLGHMLLQIADGLRRALPAPQDDDPLFAASMAEHASIVAQDPASVRNWAGAVRDAFSAIAPAAHQTPHSTLLVVDPVLVANEYAIRRLKVPPGRRNLRNTDDPRTLELLYLLSSKEPEGVKVYKNSLVVEWGAFYDSYKALGCARPLYSDLLLISPESLRQRFEQCRGISGAFVSAERYAAAVKAVGADVSAGRRTVLDITTLRRLITLKRDAPSLPKVAKTPARTYAHLTVVRTYEGLEIHFLRRGSLLYVTVPFDLSNPALSVDGNDFCLLSELSAVGADRDFVSWAKYVAAELTEVKYRNAAKKAQYAARMVRVRATKAGGYGVFSVAEDAIIIEHLDTRPYGVLTSEEVDALASKLAGRTATGVRRRLRTLLVARAKMLGWQHFRQTSWWPGGKLSQSVYASLRRTKE